MVSREIALEIKNSAQEAIGRLDSIVFDIRGRCSDEDFETIRRGVGLSIARVITEILEPLYQQHPEIDDLNS